MEQGMRDTHAVTCHSHLLQLHPLVSWSSDRLALRRRSFLIVLFGGIILMCMLRNGRPMLGSSVDFPLLLCVYSPTNIGGVCSSAKHAVTAYFDEMGQIKRSQVCPLAVRNDISLHAAYFRSFALRRCRWWPSRLQMSKRDFGRKLLRMHEVCQIRHR